MRHPATNTGRIPIWQRRGGVRFREVEPHVFECRVTAALAVAPSAPDEGHPNRSTTWRRGYYVDAYRPGLLPNAATVPTAYTVQMLRILAIEDAAPERREQTDMTPCAGLVSIHPRDPAALLARFQEAAARRAAVQQAIERQAAATAARLATEKRNRAWMQARFDAQARERLAAQERERAADARQAARRLAKGPPQVGQTRLARLQAEQDRRERMAAELEAAITTARGLK